MARPRMHFPTTLTAHSIPSFSLFPPFSPFLPRHPTSHLEQMVARIKTAGKERKEGRGKKKKQQEGKEILEVMHRQPSSVFLLNLLLPAFPRS